MPRGDHLVIDKLIFRSQMAFEAFLGAVNHVSRVVHSQRHRFLMRPRTRRVRPQPARRRPVAIFARDAFGNLKRASALLGRGV